MDRPSNGYVLSDRPGLRSHLLLSWPGHPLHARPQPANKRLYRVRLRGRRFLPCHQMALSQRLDQLH